MGFFSKIFSAQNPFKQSASPAPIKADSSDVPGAQETGPRTAQQGTMNYYEALSDSDDRSRIPLFALAARTILQSFNRDKLAFLARYLYDNDGNVSYAVDQIANYCAPIIPMAATKDSNANTVYENYFDSWCKRCDFTGRFHFGTLQRLICKSFDIEADILPEMRADHGFPQVKLYKSWKVNSFGIALDKACDGVAITNGVVTGYYVVDVDTLPSLSLLRTLPKRFVSANTAKLLGEIEDYGSYRALTPIRRGMNDVRDAKDIKGFSKLAAKIGAALSAVIQGADVEEENVWADDDNNQPISDADAAAQGVPPATQQEKKITQADLIGGIIPVLPDGKVIQQLENKHPGALVMELLEFLGGGMISGLGVPAAFFQTKKMTGPSQRGVNGQAQRKFNQRQEALAAFVEWTWVRVIAWGIQYDGLPAVAGWDKIEWQGPPQISIDSGEDATAWRDDVSAGLMTRQEHYAKRSLNWQRETDQRFIEDDYILTKANALAKKQNVPITVILEMWGYAQQKTAPPGDAQAATTANTEKQNETDSTPNN
jgi:hypothetical protein